MQSAGKFLQPFAILASGLIVGNRQRKVILRRRSLYRHEQINIIAKESGAENVQSESPCNAFQDDH